MIHGCNVGMFYYREQWVVSGYCGNNVYSRQLCYRNGKGIAEISQIISDKFWTLWKTKGWKLPDPLNKRCFMFSCHPEEGILKLVGARLKNKVFLNVYFI